MHAVATGQETGWKIDLGKSSCLQALYILNIFTLVLYAKQECGHKNLLFISKGNKVTITVPKSNFN